MIAILPLLSQLLEITKGLPVVLQSVVFIGTVTASLLLKGVLRWFYVHCIASNDLSAYGGGRARRGGAKGWALVTGASEGIGYALAAEIVARGLNVIIVARSEKVLKEHVESFKMQFPAVQTMYITADASDVEASTAKLVKACEGKILTMLVNNVGVEAGDPEPFESKSIAKIDQMININVRFSTLLTATLLPKILSDCKAHGFKGGIINLSSNASILDTPLLVGYTSSKEYIRSFSNTLAGEMKVLHGNLIDVLCIRPSFVESRMSGLKAHSVKGVLLGVATGPQFARATLNKLGTVHDVSPFWKHAITVWALTTLMPTSMNKLVMYMLTNKRYHENLKKGH